MNRPPEPQHKPVIPKRRLALAAMATMTAVWGVSPTSLLAATKDVYPTKPIRFVVAFAPGGPADIAGRLVAQQVGTRLGQSVVVENRPGAGGNVAAKYVAAQPPDGYTVLITTSAITVNQSLYKEPGYKLMRDFAPVALIAVNPNVLVVHPSEQATDLKAYLRLYKGKNVSYGSAGVGSTPHLTAEHVLHILGGINTVHVPFQGASQALTATMGNQVPVASVALQAAMPLIKAGKVKALAVSSLTRDPQLPDVPTIAESGFPNVEDYTWVCVLAPPATPGALVAQLNAAINEALRTPGLQRALMEGGMEPRPLSPAAFSNYLTQELTKWSALIKQTGITQ